MKISCTTKLNKGTTLPEVVLSVAILAIMAAGIIGSFNYGFFVMRLVRENQRATQVIMEKTETIRLYNWDQINTTFIPATFSEAYDAQAGTNSQGVTYQGTIAISSAPFAANYSANVKQITITVTWNSGVGHIPRTRSVTTLVSKDGLQNYVF